jgi:hypothetical protein
VPAGDMDPHCVVAIALRIESTPRPARSPGWADVGDKPVTNLFTGNAGPHPGVDAAKGRAAAFDPNMGLAIAAGPIAEKRRTGASAVLAAPSAARTPAETPALQIARAARRIALRGFGATGSVGVLDAIEADINYPFRKARGSVAQVTEILHLEGPPRQRLPPLVSRCKTEAVEHESGW